MKYVLIILAVILLLIPPIILGCFTWLWKPTRKGFASGACWLDDKFGYGDFVDNILQERKK